VTDAMRNVQQPFDPSRHALSLVNIARGQSCADAVELGSNNMATRKRGLVIATKLGWVVMGTSWQRFS
jgi:hypothetical protein